MSERKQSGGVSIGDVTGGIHASIIAGGDVKDAKIILGGRLTPADRDPSVEEFKQLLTEIRQALAEVTKDQALLQRISPAAPFTVQGAEQTVTTASEKVTPEIKPDESRSLQKSLAEATSLLGGVLDGARTVAQKTGEVGSAVQPLIEQLEPLVTKIGVAAFWAARLWLQG